MNLTKTFLSEDSLIDSREIKLRLNCCVILTSDFRIFTAVSLAIR